MELRLATLNIEYGDGMQVDAELRNAVDLLGRSTNSNYTGAPRVSFARDQGPWRWDADILNLNEISSGSARYTVMLDRLNARSSLRWQGVRHLQKGGSFTYDRDGVNYLNERVTGAAVDLGSSELGGPLVVEDFYASFVGAAARRLTASGAYEQRPFVVVNTYLMHDASAGGGIGPREDQYERLITSLKSSHIPAHPEAFNRAAVASPTHAENRFILVGDLNFRNHQCAESNRFVRRLREEFGYALDVAMAVTDAQDRTAPSLPGVQYRTFDMHYGGRGLINPSTRAANSLVGTYGACGSTNAVLTDVAGSECPYGWETFNHWQSAGYPRDVARQYMWWAAPSSAYGGGGSRLDTIILVGRGWADDDPVREYAVTQNIPLATPMVPSATAVELRRYCDLDDDPEDSMQRVCVNNSTCAATSTNYRPEFRVCASERDGAGHTVVRTDHKPVGVRLRVLMSP